MSYAEVEGARLWYEERGSGPPLVLLPSSLFDARMWELQFEAFADSHRVVRYDPRFFGRSDRAGSAGEWSEVDDLAALLDELRIARTALLGASAGGRVELDFALEQPQRVTALVLVATGLAGFPMRAYTPQQEAVEQEAAARGDLERIADNDLEVWAPLGVTPELRAWAIDNAHANLLGDEVAPRRPELPAVERLGEIRVPTLVITGDHDVPAMGEIGDLLEREIAGAQRVRFAGSDHFPSLREPERFNRVVLEFLGAVGA